MKTQFDAGLSELMTVFRGISVLFGCSQRRFNCYIDYSYYIDTPIDSEIKVFKPQEISVESVHCDIPLKCPLNK
jgi:hypothetical protein